MVIGAVYEARTARLVMTGPLLVGSGDSRGAILVRNKDLSLQSWFKKKQRNGRLRRSGKTSF